MAQLISRFEEIVQEDNIGSGKAIDLSTIFSLAAKETLRPSVSDGKRILLLGIDFQKDFCDEKGTLSVFPGSKRDIYNTTCFIYNNMEAITDIYLSIDCHYPLQIFFSTFWRDANNNIVPPFTLITYADVQAGKFKSIYGSPKKVLDCLKALEVAGKGGVFLWPPHCIVGTPGFALENEFAKMIHFHAIAKVSKPQFVFKGTDIYSEMYGIIEPEYNPNNEVTWQVLNAIADMNTGKIGYDEIYLCGEAASHCVLSSAEQILKRFSNMIEVLKRIVILEDCTSPVTGFETQAQEGFEKLKQQYGIRIAKSTDIIL
jgi:nicotinamidase-related amidase